METERGANSTYIVGLVAETTPNSKFISANFPFIDRQWLKVRRVCSWVRVHTGVRGMFQLRDNGVC
jgi:hypothetical protein